MTAAPVARGSNYAAVFHPAVERALPGAPSHRWAPARGWCLPPPRAPAAVTGGPRRGAGYRASPPSTSSLSRRPLPLAAAFVPLLRFCGRPRSGRWRQRRRRQRARARARAAPFTPPASTRLCPAAAPPPAQVRAGCSPRPPPPLACFGGHRRGAPARGRRDPPRYKTRGGDGSPPTRPVGSVLSPRACPPAHPFAFSRPLLLEGHSALLPRGRRITRRSRLPHEPRRWVNLARALHRELDR